MPRDVLPTRRYSETFTMQFGNLPFLVSVGYFQDARPAEVFVNLVKSGSHLEGVTHDAAVLLSIALQYGAPVSVLAGAITRTPQGAPQSVIGDILDRLAGIKPMATPIAPGPKLQPPPPTPPTPGDPPGA